MSDIARRRTTGFLAFSIGAATVALAAGLATWDDGWRVDVYFAATALSGLYAGGLRGDQWGVAAVGIACGQLITAFVWLSVGPGEDVGLGLIWPLVVVPVGLALTSAVAMTVAWLRPRLLGRGVRPNRGSNTCRQPFALNCATGEPDVAVAALVLSTMR